MTEDRLVEIADYIRARSRAGELVLLPELEAKFGGPAPDEQEEPVQALVQGVMLRFDDVKTIRSETGRSFYYSERGMTAGYANILALKYEGPLHMMAGVIREQSRTYPRPVPLALFQCPPFNLNEDQVAKVLEEMKQGSLFKDIGLVTTSIGSIFAYSSDHLDRNYASMLAEWADVGQSENP